MTSRRAAKKIIIALLLLLATAAPSYALNPIDALLGKKVFLSAVGMTVLVNRLTHEVKYFLNNKKEWVLLAGPTKKQFQAFYDVQRSVQRE